MNNEILKRLKKKSENLANYLTIRSNEKEFDYLIENLFIANKRRFVNEFNKAISNNLIDKNGYDLIISNFIHSNKSKLKELSSLSSSFGLKNGLSASESDINLDFSNLSIENFQKYQKENLKINKNVYRSLCLESEYDLFNDKSASYQNLLNESQKRVSNHKENKAPISSHSTILNNNKIHNNLANFEESVNSVSKNVSTNFNTDQQTNTLYKSSIFKSNSLHSNINSTLNTNQNSTNNMINYNNSNMNNSGTQNNNNNNNGTNNMANNNYSNSNNSLTNKFTSIRYEPRATKCYKRRNEDENNMDDDGNYEVDTKAFKSAREQLMIENAKQQQPQQQQQQQQSNYYSLAKRPMNNPPKRGIHSKFNLPIRNNEEESNNQNQNNAQSNGNNNNNKNLQAAEIASLKNVDQKLVDIILSEVMDRTPPVTWDDIAGLEFVKKTIKEIVIYPMLRPDIFNGLREPSKGLLLFGPPGTGKTLIAKCIANESKSTFFNISSSTLTSKWQGESEKLVKVLFEVARYYQPAVIFLDEIDSLLSQRSDDDRESSRRLKTEFFIQMDGARTTGEERILLIGATNRPQELDDAARRRFVKKLYIPLPEKSGRKQIVENLIKRQQCNLNEDEINDISDITDGYSGADMTHLCREAALGPIRSLEGMSIETIALEQVRPIMHCDFIDAMKQVRASVSQDDLEAYVKWNNSFGSVQIMNK